MLFDAAGGMLSLIAFAVLIEGYFRSALGLAGRGVVAAASVAFIVSTLSPTIPLTAAWLLAGMSLMGGLWLQQGLARPVPPADDGGVLARGNDR